MSDYRKGLYDRYVSAFKSNANGDRPDPASDSYMRWARSKILPLLHDVERSKPVLDLGCGFGLMLELLRQDGFIAIEGLDISEEMVALARGRDLSVSCGDVFEMLTKQQRTFGAIIALDFVEHFRKDELLEMMKLLRDRLDEGGVLVVQTPNGDGLFPNQVIYGDLTHQTVLNPGSLEQLLRISSFTDVEFCETGPAATHWKGTIRVALWRAIKAAATTIRVIETGKVQHIWTENMLCRSVAAPRA